MVPRVDRCYWAVQHRRVDSHGGVSQYKGERDGSLHYPEANLGPRAIMLTHTSPAETQPPTWHAPTPSPTSKNFIPAPAPPETSSVAPAVTPEAEADLSKCAACGAEPSNDTVAEEKKDEGKVVVSAHYVTQWQLW
jgi:hypothetical protein